MLRQEARTKNQEARTKNQEARVKSQEARTKNQEPRQIILRLFAVDYIYGKAKLREPRTKLSGTKYSLCGEPRI